MNKNAQIILDTINASTDHPTAEQVYLSLKEQGTKVSMATVYNNLASLYAKGLIRKVAVPGFPDFTESIQRDSGAQIISYDLNITYLCPECTEARVGKDALHN